MNVVVADACPVIFLAKLDRLALIREVFPGTILLPSSVFHELTRKDNALHERGRILKHCRVETVRSLGFAVSALSLADGQVLTLAKKTRKSLILTDDGLVRRIAWAEGLPVAGTLGIIIRAVRAKLLTPSEALRAVDELVAEHQLRISVDLYQETLRQIRQPG